MGEEWKDSKSQRPRKSAVEQSFLEMAANQDWTNSNTNGKGEFFLEVLFLGKKLQTTNDYQEKEN